ncbi:hypothetical protein [Pelagibacterium montanilacus]|uniref:hypothetical protein n=1 Tax=Pelagibacterium montanilacus TaxID=2185280 RepID=UPI000F8C3504|nr:hypothetical protein [Pelagibacterium montanilacus]
MVTPARISAQKKFSEMEKRQKQALDEEERTLDATRAKTARLKALRLEKERVDAEEKAATKAAKPVRKSRKA